MSLVQPLNSVWVLNMNSELILAADVTSCVCFIPHCMSVFKSDKCQVGHKWVIISPAARLWILFADLITVICCDWWMSSHSALSLVQTIEFDEGAGAVLRIQPLRAPRDENVYECVAKNTEGEVAVTSKLSIIRGEIYYHHNRYKLIMSSKCTVYCSRAAENSVLS